MSAEIVLQTDHLTKDYGQGRGIFELSLQVNRGEIFGLLGTNGAGKTTTIRSLLGFIRPDGGSCSVCGLDSWTQSAQIMKHVSYIPGEIAFPSFPTGTAFLQNQAELLGLRDLSRTHHLIEVLRLDPSADLKRMSKGMKQKTAIVAALMADREVLILDEPTTGLDPLMRDSFLELLREEKAKGRTVLMSGHIFEEIEEVCDRAAMLRDGRLLEGIDLNAKRHSRRKRFTLSFADPMAAEGFAREMGGEAAAEGTVCTLSIPVEELNRMFALSRKHGVKRLSEQHFSLAEHFMEVYKGAET